MQKFGLSFLCVTLSALRFCTADVVEEAEPKIAASIPCPQKDCGDSPSGLSQRFLTRDPSQSSGPKIVAEGESVEAIQLPSLTTQSRELSRESNCQECTGKTPSMSVSVRHIDPGGIGFKEGYTTLEGFFSLNKGSYIPFLDLRGHVFNNGKYAANAGLGLRFVSGCRSYGINSYYDYRTTKHQHYNQIEVGLESIGEKFDIFINGYLPVGSKKSPFFAKEKTTMNEISGEEFDFGFFSGNNLFLTATSGSITSSMITRKKVEFAMKGIEGFFRFTLPARNNFFVSAGAGPYYYKGDYGKHAVGGKGIVSATWKNSITARVIGSYDNLFHGKVQGEVGFTWTFGPRESQKRRKNSGDCCIPLFSQKLVSSPVINEIIVLDKHHIKKTSQVVTSLAGTTAIAIDPSTGLPYTFWFVNNTSSSAGTFESPFPTLLAAQNASSASDVIYVFAGDGTTKGMDLGINLKNFQRLLGASIPQSLPTTQGLIVIPPQGSLMPSITAPFGASVVNVAGNNSISGFQIATDAAGTINGSYCIGSVSSDTANLFVSNNILTANNGAVGIFPNNPSGQITIVGNQLNSADMLGTFGMYFAQTNGFGTYNIENNIVSDFQNTFPRPPLPEVPVGSGIVVLAENDANVIVTASGNQINECARNYLDLRAFGEGNPHLFAHVENNDMQGPGNFGMFLYTQDIATENFELLNNQVSECSFGIIAQAEGNSEITGLIKNNVLTTGMGGSGVIMQTNALDQVESAKGHFTVISNDVSFFDAQGISTNSRGSSFLTALIENNVVHDNGKAGLYMISLDSSNTDLIVLNNVINDNNGGMETEPVDDATLHIILQRNAIYNNNTTGIFAKATENGIGKYEILSNTFYNNNFTSGSSGSAVTMISQDAARLCLRMQENQASMEDPPDYYLKNTSLNEFNVEPLVGNTGTVMEIDTTPVPAGFCGP
jgi:hypothetical protein